MQPRWCKRYTHCSNRCNWPLAIDPPMPRILYGACESCSLKVQNSRFCLSDVRNKGISPAQKRSLVLYRGLLPGRHECLSGPLKESRFRRIQGLEWCKVVVQQGVVGGRLCNPKPIMGPKSSFPPSQMLVADPGKLIPITAFPETGFGNLETTF